MNNKKTILFVSAAFFIYGLFLVVFYKKNDSVNLAYITNQGENSVSVVDLNKLIVLKKISVGKSPLGISIINKKAIAVVGNIESQSLSIIDIEKNELVKTVDLKTAPLGMASDSSGDRLFVTGWYENKLLVLSTEDFSISHEINVGITPSGISFNKKNNFIAIANRDANTVEIYDGKNYVLQKKNYCGKTSIWHID